MTADMFFSNLSIHLLLLLVVVIVVLVLLLLFLLSNIHHTIYNCKYLNIFELLTNLNFPHWGIKKVFFCSILFFLNVHILM